MNPRMMIESIGYINHNLSSGDVRVPGSIKEVGKLKNNNISIEHEPNISHWQWQEPRKPPECSRKYLDPKASTVESRTCNIKGQVSLLGKQANKRPNVWCTTSMKT